MKFEENWPRGFSRSRSKVWTDEDRQQVITIPYLEKFSTIRINSNVITYVLSFVCS